MDSGRQLTFLNEDEYNNAIEDFTCQPNIGPAEGRFVKNVESCVLVVGPARVGKSTLIKALTGDQKVVTSPGIDPHTVEMAKYTVQTSIAVNGSEAAPKRTFNFWDTPGIIDWSNFTKTLKKFLDTARPLAVMICLAPGTDADTQAWISLIKECTTRSMALCLVITNKFTGNDDQFTAIVDFYKSQKLGHPLPRPSDCKYSRIICNT
jgi:GTPase SAR1 family protein